MQICPKCGKQFDPADRATPLTPEASVVQIVYCSVDCKRRAGNRRNYERHKAERLEKAKQRKQRK